MSHHADVDVEFLKQTYASCGVDLLRFLSYTVTTPLSVVALERARAIIQPLPDECQARPADLFIFNQGEPVDRSVTKVGGLPCRPASWPWPTNPKYGPLTFLGQFNFADSRDLVPAIPADLLLVYSAAIPPVMEDERNPEPQPWLYTEWYDQTRGDPLIELSQVPPNSHNIPVFWGTRYRAIDCLETEQACSAIMEELRLHGYWGDTGRGAAQCSLLLNGWKVGGHSRLRATGGSEARGTLLCTATSFMTDEDLPYPWLNHPAPVSKEVMYANAILWWDGFSLELYLTEDGSIDWWIGQLR